MTNAPCASLTVSRVNPVLTDLAVTVTPGTTPPWVSDTVPEILPVSICAQAGPNGAASATSAIAKLKRTASRLICILREGLGELPVECPGQRSPEPPRYCLC